MTKKKITMFPEVWDELTERDWASMLLLRESLLERRSDAPAVTIEDIRNEAARRLLLNRGLRTRTRNDKYMLLVAECGKRLSWLWEQDDEGRVSLVYRSTVQLQPAWDGLRGPMSHGADLVFGEFKDALALCQLYDKTGDEALLQQLAGLLYRRRAQKKGQWPLRVDYDLDGAEEQMARGRRMPRWFVWGVYAWFSFFCEYLTTGIFIIDGQEVCFKEVFKGSPESSKKGGEKDASGLGLTGIALTLAESRVFGDFEDVLHTPLMRVMMKLLQDSKALSFAKGKS